MHVNRLNLGGKALFILEKKLQQKHQDEVWNLLYDSDEEFVPPLSSINYTTQQVLSQGDMDKRGPIEYFKKMIEQEFILAIEKGKVIGFLTYIPDFLLQVEDRSVVCDYISTIVVSTNYRNHGVTRNMYHTLFENRRNKMFATVRTKIRLSRFIKSLHLSLACPCPKSGRKALFLPLFAQRT